MISYRTEDGNKVIFIREKCRCVNKRLHIFTARVSKFFFFFEHVNWFQGLKIIGTTTITYGVIHFLFYHITALRSRPSRVSSFLLFPWMTLVHYAEAISLIVNGIFLLRGIYQGHLNYIRNYPWVLLSSYVFAGAHIWNLIWQGDLIALALALSDFGMHIKADAEADWSIIKIERMTFYILLSSLILVDLILPTYLIILSLSWIDKLEADMESQCFTV